MTVLDSGFHSVDSGFQVLDLRFCLRGSCSPDSSRLRDSGFLELYSGFQNPGFPISQIKSPGLRIPQQKFPGSGIQIPVCGATSRLKGLCHLCCYLFITCLPVSGISKIMVQYIEGHWSIETVSCRLLLQMAGIDMDWNLAIFFFKFLILCLQIKFITRN